MKRVGGGREIEDRAIERREKRGRERRGGGRRGEKREREDTECERERRGEESERVCCVPSIMFEKSLSLIQWMTRYGLQ